jgi:MYXO-CTERM domain-containing protein
MPFPSIRPHQVSTRLRRTRSAAVGAAVLLMAALSGGTAQATPDFPAAVAQDLALPSITIDAPNGCTLCHTTDAGGTALHPFGQLLQSYGVGPYDQNSLKLALEEIALQEPQLIADIKAGKDPNGDISASSVQYGCSATSGPRDRASAAAFVLAAVALVLLERARRRRVRNDR